MTHRQITTLDDGTRVYADGHRYRPRPSDERKYQVRRPDHPDAVRFHGRWFVPLELLPDDERLMPATRPFRDPRSH